MINDVVKQGKIISKYLFPYIYSSSVELNNFRIDMKTDFKLTSDVVCNSLI